MGAEVLNYDSNQVPYLNGDNYVSALDDYSKALALRIKLLEDTITGTGSGYAKADDPRFTDARQPLQHTHPVSEVNGLQAQLDNLATATTGTSIRTQLLTVDGAGSGIDADLLDGKHASSFSLTTHTHTIANVTGLQAQLDNLATGISAESIKAQLLTVDGEGSGINADLLDGKDSTAFAPVSHTHTQGEVTGLVNAIAAKANVTDVYDKTTADSTFAPMSHTHTNVYAPAVHTHDDRYYTEAEVDAKITAASSSAVSPRSITPDKTNIWTPENIIPNGDLWADTAVPFPTSLTRNTTDAPAGYAACVQCVAGSNGGSASNQELIPVIPGSKYAFEVWLKADIPESVIFIELRNQSGAHAGTMAAGIVNAGDFALSASPYLVGNLKVPTEWTRFSGVYTMSATTSAVRLGSFYTNHTSGTTRGAVQSIAGMRLTPLPSQGLVNAATVATLLTTATDLNTLTTTGKYRFNSDALAQGSDNIPTSRKTNDAGKAGLLEVFAEDPQWVWQRYTSHLTWGTIQWQRNKYDTAWGPWKEVRDESWTQIPSNTDLNTLTKPDDYVCVSTATAATCLNIPSSWTAVAFKLEVSVPDLVAQNSSTPHVWQRLTPYWSQSNGEYARGKYNSGWGAWKFIPWSPATSTSDGYMTAADKANLDRINAITAVTPAKDGYMTAADKSKLNKLIDAPWVEITPPAQWAVNTTGGQRLRFRIVKGVVQFQGGFNIVGNPDIGFYPYMAESGAIPDAYRPDVSIAVIGVCSSGGMAMFTIDPNGSVHAEKAYSVGATASGGFWRIEGTYPAKSSVTA